MRRQQRIYRGIEISPNNGAENYYRWWVDIVPRKRQFGPPQFRTLDECREFIKRTLADADNGDLNIGDTVGYRLHNSTEIIKDHPAKVVSKSHGELLLDNGLKLIPQDGHWVWPLEDQC